MAFHMRPAVAPLDLVDQQHAAAVDLVLLPLPGPVYVDCMIDDPGVASLIDGDRIMAGSEPAFALKQHQAVGDALGLLECLKWPEGFCRARNHHSIFGMRAATIVARIEEIIIIIAANYPGGFDKTREGAFHRIGPDQVCGLASRREFHGDLVPVPAP